MKFELDYKNLHFIITLNIEENFIPDNRFEKLSNQSLIMLKKKEILAYSMMINANDDIDNLSFYLSGVLLSSNQEEMIEELQEYLDAENVIEDIFEKWKLLKEDGPSW